jgi:hypothetical protein
VRCLGFRGQAWPSDRTWGLMELDACHECGNPLSVHSNICPRCGARAPSKLAFGLGIAAAVTLGGCLLYFAASDFLHAPPPTDTTPEVMPEADLGPGSKFDSDHPNFLALIRGMIIAQGHRCPAIVNLWDEGGSSDGGRLEALCGPNTNHFDPTLHYAVYTNRQMVDVCQPWKEFGPECK